MQNAGFPPRLRGVRGKAEAALPGRLMDRLAHYDWPFFDERHAKLAIEADAWAHAQPRPCARRGRGRDLQAAGAGPRLRRVPPPLRVGAPRRALDRAAARGLRLPRRARGFRLRHGGPRQHSDHPRRHSGAEAALPGPGRRGRGHRRVRAFRARRRLRRAGAEDPSAARGDGWLLDGEKTWISNGGIAHFYVVFARSRGGNQRVHRRGRRGRRVSAHRNRGAAPHGERTAAGQPRAELLGEAGQGFKLAMRGLDMFRTTVAGAALGFARRALDEALAAGARPQDVRPDPGRLPDDPGEARRHGDRHRRRGAAHLSRRRGKRTPAPRA